MRLTFDNATTFNESGSLVYNSAKKLKALFEKQFSQKNIVTKKKTPTFSLTSNSDKLKEIVKLQESLKSVQQELLNLREKKYTEEETHELISKVVNLKADHLIEIVKIVRIYSPSAHTFQNSDQEIILDFEKIPNEILQRVDGYINTLFG